MILSGKRIQQLVDEKILVIDPFDSVNLNPNSYNLSLGNKLLVYEANYNWQQRWGHDVYPFLLPHQWQHHTWDDTRILDMKKDNKTMEIEIPPEGIILYPGMFYLASTVEYTETPPPYTPMLEGRSSIGRLGLEIHICAGFGDSGFNGPWTLELGVKSPLRVYSGVPICQILYHTVEGEIEPYKGKYQGQRGPKPSGIWKEFLPKEKT